MWNKWTAWASLESIWNAFCLLRSRVPLPVTRTVGHELVCPTQFWSCLCYSLVKAQTLHDVFILFFCMFFSWLLRWNLRWKASKVCSWCFLTIPRALLASLCGGLFCGFIQILGLLFTSWWTACSTEERLPLTLFWNADTHRCITFTGSIQASASSTHDIKALPCFLGTYRNVWKRDS